MLKSLSACGTYRSERVLIGTFRLKIWTRMSTRFDCAFLVEILRKSILLFVSSKGCSVFLIAGNWAFLVIAKMPKLLWHVLDLFWHYNFFANPVLKMTRVSHFLCQNDAGFCVLNKFLWGNLVLVVVLIQESKALYLCSNVIIRIGGHGWLMSSWSKCKSDEPWLVEPK